MKAISIGRNYTIYDDSMKTYDKFPAQLYRLQFSKMSGFYFESVDDIKIYEDKIYGDFDSKIKKVTKSFGAFKKNLGVILSGDKGIGKSLFAKLLAKEMVDLGYPVIMVDKYYPGMVYTLEDIDQECVVLFDEFDKTVKQCNRDGENEQDALLSMFDGMSNTKKLFIITCNNLNNVSTYLLNRPGRFHYHFRFKYLNKQDITEYLLDKLDTKYHSEIQNVVKFSNLVNLNYDRLSAIAFELNSGIPFVEAIEDLNIINIEPHRYTLYGEFDNGLTLKSSSTYQIDMFGEGNSDSTFLYLGNHGLVYAKFDTKISNLAKNRITSISL